MTHRTPGNQSANTATKIASVMVGLEGEQFKAPKLDGLRATDLAFTRGVTPILEDVSFHVPRGSLLAIVGPSGAGKSTLLSLLAGFESPTHGRVTFDERDWATHTPSERSIGMSFDDAALHEHLTVAENLDSAALARNEPTDRRRARVAGLAATLGVTHALDRLPHTLSAGERRRVSVGRAFIRAPHTVLLDEPFANLDRANRFTIRQLIRELQRSSSTTAVLVTHDPTDAVAIADTLLVLIKGRARAYGAAVDIARTPPDLEVAQLVDDLGMHVIEMPRDVCAGNPCDDLVFAAEFLERLRDRLCAAQRSDPTLTGSILLGVRPSQIRVGPPSAPSIAINAQLVACEPAGHFTDLIALRSDGRPIRARVAPSDAQELPMNTPVRFHIHETDVHVFAAPFPGRRLL